jgi:hypothetical protein
VLILPDPPPHQLRHSLLPLSLLLPLQVLQEMLDMLRDHQQNHHSARLEWIIIWLIAGMHAWCQCTFLFGF